MFMSHFVRLVACWAGQHHVVLCQDPELAHADTLPPAGISSASLSVGLLVIPLNLLLHV